jgi:hypothetical protein
MESHFISLENVVTSTLSLTLGQTLPSQTGRLGPAAASPEIRTLMFIIRHTGTPTLRPSGLVSAAALLAGNRLQLPRAG